MGKLHWQVDYKIGIDGSMPKTPMLAICGAAWPDFTCDRKKVTCKKCLKKLDREQKP